MKNTLQHVLERKETPSLRQDNEAQTDPKDESVIEIVADSFPVDGLKSLHQQ